MKRATAASLFAALSLAAPTRADWRVRSEVSPIDDSTNVTLALPADETVSLEIGNYRPELVATCQEGETGLYLHYGFFLSTQNLPVLTRFDKEKAHTSTWLTMSAHDAVAVGFGWARAAGLELRPIPDDERFLEKLLGHDTLLVRLTPYGKDPVTSTFKLAGLSDAIGQLLDHCPFDAGRRDNVAGLRGVSYPKVVHQVDPEYPPAALAQKLRTLVMLRVLVRRDGTVGDVEIVSLSKKGVGFEEAATAAVRQWRFEPSELNGAAVDAYYSISMPFNAK